MEIILNLTQHPASQEQKEAGVVDVAAKHRERLTKALTFETLPVWQDVKDSALEICNILGADEYKDVRAVMLGGAPFFVSYLDQVLSLSGYDVLYAFSKRVSEEKTLDNGEVVKTSRFKHEGFVRSFG